MADQLPGWNTQPPTARRNVGTGGGTGPQGAQGAQGPQGADGGGGGGSGSQGAQGAQGATGTTGSQGAPGTNGTNGSQGAQGAQGAVGSQGPQGFQGTTGTGSQGSQGAQGAGATIKTLPYFKGTNAAGTVLPALTTGNVGFTSVTDPGSLWNSTTKVFTAPVAGTYRIFEHADANPGVARYAFIFKNGTSYVAQSPRTPATIGSSEMWVHDVVLAISDTIALRYNASITIDNPVQTGAENNYFTVQLLAMTYV